MLFMHVIKKPIEIFNLDYYVLTVEDCSLTNFENNSRLKSNLKPDFPTLAYHYWMID